MKIATLTSAMAPDGRSRAQKQVALFCHLAKMLWTLSCRIRWNRLDGGDVLRLEAVQPMLDRAAAKARNASGGTTNDEAA